MAAMATADTVAGARRAVVRSEKFMEWQRELSSSRIAYGGRKHYDEAGVHVAISGSNKHSTKRPSSDEDVVKPLEGSDERNEKAVASLHVEGQTMKIKKQQQQWQHSEVKRQKKEHDVQTRRGQGKDFSDPASTEGGRIRRCKQQCSQGRHFRHQQEPQSQQPQQQPSLDQPFSSRKQQQIPVSSLVKKSVEQGLPSLKRTKGQEVSPLPDPPSRRGSKRSKRMAQRLIHEEPLSPPLKLPKLHLVLTRKEIQEDWFKITGNKYSGKPRKSTLVQLGLGLCTSLTCPSSIRYLNSH